ncbi:unnamed protein product [Arabis nemorensis]|uniref:Uncharacterized protein n=1 Tax=Arabis nemorensis TaxID=586526 RepID=A0A565CLN9_9BRAS|nr:unnamed protein product [Arabis nemorensis]
MSPSDRALLHLVADTSPRRRCHLVDRTLIHLAAPSLPSLRDTSSIDHLSGII